MSHQLKTQLATERMQTDFTLFKELTKRLGELRKDSSPAKVKESGIDKLVFDHTGIKIKFGIHKSKQVNAYMMPPQIDRNHPFWAMGYSFPADPEQVKALGMGKKKPVEVWTNDADYTVGGTWSTVEIEIMILRGLMNLKSISDAGVAAIFLHELGHAYTYFSLFGKLSRKNWLTTEAIKDILKVEDHEKRIQRLEMLEKDLDIDIKDKEKIIQSPDKMRGDLIETIVISELMQPSPTTSSHAGYDARNIEQIADQFAIFHGAGADLGQAMVEMYRGFGMVEAKSNFTFVILEILKVVFMIVVTMHSPLYTILFLLIAIPGYKIYDDPAARVELMRKQMVGQLKQLKDQPEMHKKIMEQLEVLESLKGALKDRRSLYTLVYQTISPRGRTMYRQEVFMKSVENLLYNDTYFNAARFGALANEN